MSTIHDIPAEEQAYRKRVENELEEEFLFRVTTYMVEDVNKISIQLMNIDDEDTETVQTDEASEKEDLGKYGLFLPTCTGTNFYKVVLISIYRALNFF
jgi:hypothetical protein